MTRSLAGRHRSQEAGPLCAFVSDDEKPAVRAIGLVAFDLPLASGRHPTVGGDYEYGRHGTLTLMPGLDLPSGHGHSAVVDRRLSRGFIAPTQRASAVTFPPKRESL